MANITKVLAREILDSRGNPTIEGEVHLDDGTKAWSQVPSGASTGEHEALELRDGDKKRFGGKGVLTAVENVNTKIAQIVVGMDPERQKEIDDAMITLDGTEYKSALGANAILAVSMAVCRAGAAIKKVSLYRHIADLHDSGDARGKKLTTPVPMFNVINGGEHADNGLAMQEYKVVPDGITTFKEQYRAGAEIFHALQKNLAADGHVTAVGDEGGFAPRLATNAAPLAEIDRAVKDAGYTPGVDTHNDIDAAANSFYFEDCNHYAFKIENRALSREELLDVYAQWIDEYHLMSIEDGLSENDWEGWTMMNNKLGDRVMTIGDDLLVTNTKRLQQAIDKGACNAILIKPNQIGTVSETLACMALAQKHHMKTIVSHRSGETTDDFIADLAVGANGDYIKTGAPSRGERICKYNRLLTIEQQLLET